jgi:hypothetical protein
VVYHLGIAPPPGPAQAAPRLLRRRVAEGDQQPRLGVRREAEQIEQALPRDDLRAFRGAYLETAQRLKEQQGAPGGGGEPAIPEADQLDFEFVLFASAVIDYDYIMKLIAKYSGQDPKQIRISREQLIGLIQSDAKFLDEFDDWANFMERDDERRNVCPR